MKKYTQEEYNAIERDSDGFKICPTGDYSNIEHFEDNCDFEKECVFASDSKFGNCCIFGKQCIFGIRCKFGRRCRFGIYCYFGYCNTFDGKCEFMYGCDFGNGCKFNESIFEDICVFGNCCTFSNCTISDNCNFGCYCEFTKGCKVEGNIELLDLIKFESTAGGICTYFIKHSKGIYIRSGNFNGSIYEFRELLSEEKYYDNNIAKILLTLADLVELEK